MSDVNRATARSVAEEVLAQWVRESPDLEGLAINRVEEHARAWIVRYGIVRYGESSGPTDGLVGTSPLVVDKTNGEVHVYGSAPEEHDKFLAWLDRG